MSNTEPCYDALPEGWVCTKLADVIEAIDTGFPSGKHNVNKVGVPHLRPMNISIRGEINLSDVLYVESSDYKTLIAGDVLFNNTNSPKLVGKTAYINKNTNWAFSNHMTRIRVSQEYLDPHYLAKYLHYLYYTGFFRMWCTNHVNQASINRSFLMKNVTVILPPLPEQHRIVAKIEELFTQLDAGVASLTTALVQLKRYRQSVLKAAIEGRLTEKWRLDNPDIKPVVELIKKISLKNQSKKRHAKDQTNEKVSDSLNIPDSWKWIQVQDVGEAKLGRQRAPQYHQGQYMRPYLRVANVYEDHIDTSDILEMNFSPEEYETYHLQYGDILLNEGQSKELVGRPAIFRNEVSNACFQNTLVRFRAYDDILPEYCLIVFRAYLHTGKFLRIAQWTTNIAHLGAQRFAMMEFPLPPLAEQHEIVAEVERRFTIINEMEKTIQKSLTQAEHLRQSILKRAFEGILVPQDPHDEPASLLLERIKKEKGTLKAAAKGQKKTKRSGKSKTTQQELI